MVLKAESTGVEKKFYELCSRLCEELGLEIYDLDYLKGSHTLRVFIMNPETKTAVLEECSKLDRALTPYIEEEEWMPSELTLEVSSPGMFRHLSKVEHFEMSLEEDIQFTIRARLTQDLFPGIPKSLQGERKILGKLLKVTEETITVLSHDYELTLKYEDIKKANLEPELNLE
ncbi:hypothetical protein BIY24_08725 [Halobacteriovorax marinus]|uniref:ribosome maturation factor RimP n=1 Tax=Halobacteriovorax marinus TaxID=97084 RepID=UPI000BC2D05D|nr:hypothetical protein [Halobacteriovorax marinus]ATH08031.1 hypothetical protein BIY24_08725 [Halobacteriovorax marinus]